MNARRDIFSNIPIDVSYSELFRIIKILALNVLIEQLSYDLILKHISILFIVFTYHIDLYILAYLIIIKLSYDMFL